MKFATIAFVLFSFSAMAQDKEVLSKAKELMTSNIDQRISILQETKSCVSAAESKEQLKECRQKMHSKMKDLKEDIKNDREELKSTFDKVKKGKKEKKK